MKECDTRISSGATETAQWVTFAAKPEFGPEPTWWKERMESHTLFFNHPHPLHRSVCSHIYHTINKCDYLLSGLALVTWKLSA